MSEIVQSQKMTYDMFCEDYSYKKKHENTLGSSNKYHIRTQSKCSVYVIMIK